MTHAFDPIRYKQTTLDQWQSAAKSWSDWGPLLRRWLGPATELMLDMCRVRADSRVLDVAAGAGDQSLQAAERGARVLATDISPRILEFAEANARAAGLRIETRAVDGENLDVAAASFDAVISRVGLIYFPDQQRALAGMRAALVPGGRIGAIVYSPADRNGFFSIPISIVRKRANLPPPAPGQPGAFSLGGPGVLQQVLETAGFRDVEVRTVAAPLCTASVAECVRFERESFGALHQMMTSLEPAEQEDTWLEIERALAQFDTSAGCVAPCELLVAAGTR